MVDKEQTREAKDKGQLFIVSAPSGGGKTSLVARLLQTLNQIEVSVSHTTRQKRPGEMEGVHYYYVTKDAFTKLVKQNAFIEHAEVFGHAYGTSYAEVNERLNAGIDVVLDIDWQGALQIKRLYSDAVGIFVMPPSIDVLLQRLQDRQQDNVAVIEQRMQQARREMSHYADFDYMLINDQFEVALSELASIVVAERLKLKRQMHRQQKLLSFLLTTQ